MGRPPVVVDLGSDLALARDLSAGGVFVPGCALPLDSECELIVRAGDQELALAGHVVFVSERGAGIQILGYDAELKQQLQQLADIAACADVITLPRTESVSRGAAETAQAVAERAAEPELPEELDGDDDAADGEEPKRKVALNVQQRLRGLTLAQQVKLAHSGEMTVRIALERMYHKDVWEPLLRNPRITAPEVARIARMGSLPRVLIEVIVGNGTWLQVPEVRRALLSNPKLGVDQILRVLRLLPKHELKLAALQTAYPHAVRDAARKMIKDT